MRIYDISVPLSSDLLVYPGDPSIRITPWAQIAEGEPANVSRLILCTHSGTHIDAPRHFLEEGNTVDQVPLDALMGPALVAELPDAKVIGLSELQRFPLRGVQRLLLKTGNSELWKKTTFTANYAALSPEGARYLVEMGVKLIGIDYLSVERYDGDGSVHKTLLERGIVILEGLDLGEVAPGEYELVCLPMRVAGADGAPVRALLKGPAHPGTQPGFDPHSTKWPLA